ncbi:MFS transporter [Butyrivibrio sp. VCD2006]|uniref:MFS transporter n=1 Tax=Butyrivibrio sp. VCD2006 TaxID=1280664 RepID=UPI0003FF5AA3|nr:MFS transporter [Butyrivibrio sp. VCD2006]
MEQNSITYKNIFSDSNYRNLLLSEMIDRFGDSVDALAFTWLVYQITGSAMWSAIVFALNMLPNVIVQPFAGAIVERQDKKKVIILTYILRAIVISLFAVLYVLGRVNAPVMAVLTLLITTIESFSLPANSAFTAQVIRKEHLTCGLSLSKMLTSAATMIGTGIAGVIIAAWGAVPAMLIDISTFIIAAMFILLMKNEKASDARVTDEIEVGMFSEEAEAKDNYEETESRDNSSEKFIALFTDGIRYVAKTPIVRNFCILCVALNFMLVPINALQAPMAEEIFRMGGELLSFGGIFASLGGIAGAALLPALSKKLSPLQVVCRGTSVLGMGLMGIAMGSIVSGKAILCYIVVSACFFGMTLAATLIGGIIGIQFMKSVDSEYMARASAVFNAFSTAAMPIGSLLVSVLVSRIATDRLMLFGSIFAGIVLAVTLISRPVLEKREEITHAA